MSLLIDPGRLQDARSALDAAVERLRTLVAGRVGADGLDAHQLAAYELAWAAARQKAAAATTEWAATTGDELAAAIAAVATGEAVTAVRSLLQTLGDGEDQPVTGWPAGAGEAPRVAGWLGPANLARIGRAFLDEGTIGDLEIAEDRALCATFRDFARREIAPVAQAIHRQDADIPDDLIRKLAHLGLFGLSIPVEYGGSQDRLADYRSMLIATEELSRASLTVGGSLMTRPEIIVRAILRAGTETQKRRWLPAIASGDKLVAVATTEPDHGSDLGGIRCRASREGDGSWTVNGTKLWCTFAGRAHLLMLLVRTGKAGPGGLSVFVVEKPSFPGQAFDHRQDGGGVLLGRAIPTIGYRGMHTFELVFDDFRLPAEALLGGLDWLNRGFGLQLEGFAVGRLQTAGRAVGLMQAALTDALAYARQRSVFGNPIGAYQLPQVMLGWMAVRTNAARQISYQAARALTQGGGQADAALAKLYAARMAEFVARDAMQLHGAMGYGEETPVSRYFVDARVLTIFEGTEEVLALRVIARSMLDPKGASGEHAGVSTSHRAR